MAVDVYFSHEARRSKPAACSAAGMLHVVGQVANRVFPDLSVRFARTLLSKPTSSSHRGVVSDDYQRETLVHDSGVLQIYSLGEGPVVLFVHGWSGNACQFDSLMRGVAAKGFKAVSFDQFRHGKSTGVDSNYLLFIKATNLVRGFMEHQGEPVTAVVGHSVGGTASLNAFASCPVPHVLISPLVGVYQQFRESALSIGIPASIIDGVTRSVESDTGLSFASNDETNRLLSFGASVKLMHSSRDRIVPSTRSESLRLMCPELDLDVGRYGGHTSILKKGYTKSEVSNWLALQLSRQ